MSVSFMLMMNGAIGGLSDRDRWVTHFTCRWQNGFDTNAQLQSVAELAEPGDIFTRA